MQMAHPTQTSTPGIEREILDQIDNLHRELEARRSMQRPAPSCIVRAYHELLERHYTLLDRLDP